MSRPALAAARGVSRARARAALALSLGFLLGLAGSARAQEPAAAPAPLPEPTLERVWVPRKAFTRVLARHPSGVLVESARLEELLQRARAEAAAGRVPPREEGPQVATMEQLSFEGRLEGEVVLCEARARVSLQGGRAALPLPLSGIGLTGIWVDEAPAQVVVARGEGGESGPVVLLAGGARSRALRWTFALPVSAPSAQAERGAGQISLPVPAAASGSFNLDLPGEFEHLGEGGAGARWREELPRGGTRLRVAFGGGAAAATGPLSLSLGWRPRRALDQAVPYVTAADMSLCTLRRGVATLSARVELAISRAPRSGFVCEVPPGFVVRELTSPQGAPSYLQRGDRVEVSWPTPRIGALTLVLSAERPSNAQEETLQLRPVRWLDLDRQAGALGIAAGSETVLGFPEEPQDLERTDLSELRVQGEASLVRVYQHQGQGQVQVLSQALAPRVSLEVLAAVQVQPRQLKALAFYRYSIQAGTIFSVRAQLPEGFSLSRALVSQGGVAPGRGELAHRIEERRSASGQLELGVELERGLRGPAELLLTLECERELSRAVAEGGSVAIPRFDGSPRHELRGLLGFSSDSTFRLSGRALKGLQGIPAAGLPAAGLDVADLSLGYRVEREDYAGELVVARRESRLSVAQREHHSVGERLLTSEVDLDLSVSGAPLTGLELWLPAGAGQLASFAGPGLTRERERVASAEGRERWRLHFVDPWSGERTLRVRFQTQLPPGEAPQGGAGAPREADLPRLEVADAFRQRGALAVFGEGDAELSATPRGLRPLDPTEAPSLDGERAERARPLFAYTWARRDHGLRLSIQRPGVTPVLTAVAESLSITTSAGPDGTARHEARFRVKNLDNQFFGLALPEGATLWSVVVDGQGVKPAAQDAVLLVPIPSAPSQRGAATEIVVTYTQAGGPWGLFSAAELEAPALTLGTSSSDAVPVLRTTWALSLPEDTRVLEVAGNLRPAEALSPLQPLLFNAWALGRRHTLPWLLLALGIPSLVLCASARGRAGALALCAGVSRRTRAVSAGAAALPWRRILSFLGLALLVLGALALLKTCVGGLAMEARTPTALSRADLGERAKAAEGGVSGGSFGEDQVAASRGEEDFEAGRLGGSANSVEPARQVPEEQLELEGEAADGAERELAPARPAKQAREKARKEVRLQRSRPSTLPPPPAPTDLSAADRAPDANAAAPEPEEPSADPVAPGGAAFRNADLDADLDDATGDARGLLARDLKNKKDSGSKQEEEALKQVALAKELNRVAQAQAETKPAARINDLGAGGEAGLRSLVLGLRSVGAERQFTRAGGGAQLRLQLASERAFLLGAGCAALLAFLGAGLLPASRRLSGLALVSFGLVLSTALPLLSSSAFVAALANALTLGLLGAVPPLALSALSRLWASQPFARLGRAMREA